MIAVQLFYLDSWPVVLELHGLRSKWCANVRGSEDSRTRSLAKL